MASIPDSAKLVIQNFVDKYPFPKTNDEDSANWTHQLCEQLAYSFPGDGWGHKSAGAGRPHSADVIALQSPFIGWDIIISAGSPDARLNLNTDSTILAGQIFEPVTPRNYLESTPPIEPPVEPPVSTEWQTAVLEELKKQTVLLMKIAGGVEVGIGEIKKSIEGGIKIRLG
jgi:hypothetical protein